MKLLAEALRAVRDGRRPAVVPYLMVDRARRRRLGPTVGALADAGAVALELGFPFSDPIADGPTLEAAADRALAHGTRWSDLLAQVHVASARLPTAVMTYANPVWARGLARATGELRRAGASGLIVPDLTLEEVTPWKEAADHAGLSLVLLAAPSASPSRVARIARRSEGFLYLVSRYGTTGRNSPAPGTELGPLVEAAHRASPHLAVLLGFGVRDPATARAALRSGADGVVVGSALEEVVRRASSAREVGAWLSRIVGAAHRPGRAGRREGR